MTTRHAHTYTCIHYYAHDRVQLSMRLMIKDWWIHVCMYVCMYMEVPAALHVLYDDRKMNPSILK
jgi:hypothetical protein